MFVGRALVPMTRSHSSLVMANEPVDLSCPSLQLLTIYVSSYAVGAFKIEVGSGGAVSRLTPTENVNC